MTDLSEIRQEINRIDAALKPLLKNRMDCAGQVAESKLYEANQTNRKPVIFVGPREQEILSGVEAEEHTEAVRRLMKEIMGISRRYQYHLLVRCAALTDPYGEYRAESETRLSVAEGRLTGALQIVARYAVTVVTADAETLVLSAADVDEMHALRVQLAEEGYIR